MPFGLCAQMDAMNHVLDGSPDAPCEGAIIRGKDMPEHADDTLP